MVPRNYSLFIAFSFQIHYIKVNKRKRAAPQLKRRVLCVFVELLYKIYTAVQIYGNLK